MSQTPFELDSLTDLGPTGFRACIIAFALALSDREVSLSEVARQAGVSRQALHKSHPTAVEFVAWLRNDWKPPASPRSRDREELAEKLAAAERRHEKEKARRRAAEQERDQALHHLELAIATLEFVKAPGAPVQVLRPSPTGSM